MWFCLNDTGSHINRGSLKISTPKMDIITSDLEEEKACQI